MNYLKPLLLIIFVSLLQSPLLLATDNKTEAVNIAVQQQTETQQDCLEQINQLAQRGCCSHHGGVCGCDVSGRKKCCDGTLSPSCTCNALTDDNKNL